MSATASKTNGRGDPDVIESAAVALERYQPPATTALFGTADPVEVIERASRVATALKDVVTRQRLVTIIGGKEHPRVEAWQTLGAMLGVFPVKEWVREIPWPDAVPAQLRDARDRGLAFGFKASFVAQRPDGAILGGGEAECMRTEARWVSSEDYALCSMSQTRATSKALSGPLRFVMALAGYETTPAEEMDGVVRSQPTSQPTAKAPKPTRRPLEANERHAIYKRAESAGLTWPQFANAIKAMWGDDEVEWKTDAAAKNYLSRAIERLSAVKVPDALTAIDSAGSRS